MDHSTITKAIIKSQHCQRNWDLTQTIPQDDINLIITAATQCPSKQNIAFYKLHVITNRDVIETIHANTVGFVVKLHPKPEYTTNPQTLANMVLVFEEYFDINNSKDSARNDQTRLLSKGITNPTSEMILKKDQQMAVGVAAGYVNLTSTLLGYSTGCCTCMNHEKIKEILNLNSKPILLMGVGFKNLDKNRRIHQLDDSYMFPTKQKQKIEVNIVN